MSKRTKLLDYEVKYYPEFRKNLDKLTKGEKSEMRKAVRLANKAGAQLVVDKAKELVPVSDRRVAKSKHLKGAIRNVSTVSSAKIKAGNKNVWWHWMRHAGSTKILWKTRSYPPGVPYLHEAIKSTRGKARKLQKKEMDKVIASWNSDQRKAFAARKGRI